MDNKYGLGSAKASNEHHHSHHKTVLSAANCKFCGASELELSLTMHDHRCIECGEWQNDVPEGYAAGRASTY